MPANSFLELNLLPSFAAKNGYKVVIPGELYNALFELIEKLLCDGSPDPEGIRWLEAMRQEMLAQATPVKERQKIIEAKTLPGLP